MKQIVIEMPDIVNLNEEAICDEGSIIAFSNNGIPFMLVSNNNNSFVFKPLELLFKNTSSAHFFNSTEMYDSIEAAIKDGKTVYIFESLHDLCRWVLNTRYGIDLP